MVEAGGAGSASVNTRRRSGNSFNGQDRWWPRTGAEGFLGRTAICSEWLKLSVHRGKWQKVRLKT